MQDSSVATADLGRERQLRRLPLPRRLVRIFGRAVAVAFMVSLLSYIFLRLVPGDPVTALLGENYTPQAAAALRAQLGIQGGFFEQVGLYYWRILHGNLGVSLSTGGSVSREIFTAMPVTLSVMACTTVVTVLVSLPLAVFSARHPNSWLSRFLVVAFSVLVSSPSFFLGQIALLIFALHLHMAPVAGIEPGFGGALQSLWLPAIVVGAGIIPVVTRVLSMAISDTMTEEFVEMAIVRGVQRTRFTWRYLLRPSIGPTISVLGYIVGSMFASTVIVELIFNFNGIGQLLINAINDRDYPVVQGIALISGVIVVIIVTIAEFLNAVIDPRTSEQ